MDKVQIVNYIEIKGETMEMYMLGPEEKQRIAELLQERLMTLAGFRRKSA